MTDEFARIERDWAGNPVDLYWLDPREVSIVHNPDGSVRAYVWKPPSTGPTAADPHSWANPRLIEHHESRRERRRRLGLRWWQKEAK